MARRGIHWLLVLLVAGCASTYVKYKPGPHDKGVRYNLPKPYLAVRPAVDADKTVVDGFYTLEIAYLPDPDEEYSIHVIAGVGTNKTTIVLDQGWRLDALDIVADSKTDENIKAIAGLLGAVSPLVKTEGPNQVRPSEATVRVRGNNIPIGYYEAVVSEGPDYKKHLYGWRYVGFMPYAPCPVKATGAEALHCSPTDLWGIVVEDDVMTMRPLGVIAGAEVRVTKKSAIGAGDRGQELTAEFRKFLAGSEGTVQKLRAMTNDPDLKPENVSVVELTGGIAEVQFALQPALLQADVKKLAELRIELQKYLKASLEKHHVLGVIAAKLAVSLKART